MANFLFSHNTLVGLLIFSLGIALAFPACFLLFIRPGRGGVQSQAIMTAACWSISWAGSPSTVSRTRCDHAVGAPAHPGGKGPVSRSHDRLDSLASRESWRADRDRAVMMLFVAGILEGGFRQLSRTRPGDSPSGGCTGLMWLSYFTLAGDADDGRGIAERPRFGLPGGTHGEAAKHRDHRPGGRNAVFDLADQANAPPPLRSTCSSGPSRLPFLSDFGFRVFGAFKLTGQIGLTVALSIMLVLGCGPQPLLHPFRTGLAGVDAGQAGGRNPCGRPQGGPRRRPPSSPAT